jgi:hypothetical protein
MSATGRSRPTRTVTLDPGAVLYEPPEPPLHLSDQAKAEWRRLAPSLVAYRSVRGSDLRTFELLVETLVTEAQARTLHRRDRAPQAPSASRLRVADESRMRFEVTKNKSIDMTVSAEASVPATSANPGLRHIGGSALDGSDEAIMGQLSRTLWCRKAYRRKNGLPRSRRRSQAWLHSSRPTS